ncbi:urea amidolyase family protein [Castellaniella sp.]|uniref:5-oxoprolinase subunit B/C family protein n=1 Tax=Castellaniella sp. TaxID=1955812 RepID=UPI002AFE8549|nr:urea amidolyase family protein [Castellaniella sp.]
MRAPRFLPAGDAALLVELNSLGDVLALFQVAGAALLPGVTDLVPAARTLLVQFQPVQVASQAVVRWLQQCLTRASGAVDPSNGGERQVDIPVRYIGEDLDEVAERLGLDRTEVIERHTGSDFQAAFAGFAPGFVYLTGGDPCFLGLPRRASPRTRVPAGSVAAAGEFSAVYPSDSPGGWQLLGVTSARMWDLSRAAPALVQPGYRVRFRDLDKPSVCISLPEETALSSGQSAAAPVAAERAAPDEDPSVVKLEVRRAGVQTLFQDLGRPGLTGMGVACSGALDRTAARQANQLVGNKAGAVVLEHALGGLELVCHGQAVLAITGGQAPVVLTTASGVRLPAAAQRALTVTDGQILRIGQVRAGVRCYVAVRGGWAAAPVLGSCATDVLAGIGPAPIRAGDILAVGQGTELASPALDAAGAAPDASGGRDFAGRWDRADSLPQAGDEVTLDVVLGPRQDWFEPSALDLLLSQEWLVTPQSNRVGMRLSGAGALTRRKTQELPSEGTVIGAIQVPASGQPVLFLADHPLTGGYPVIAVVCSRHLDRLAQIPVGARLRFRPDK